MIHIQVTDQKKVLMFGEQNMRNSRQRSKFKNGFPQLHDYLYAIQHFSPGVKYD